MTFLDWLGNRKARYLAATVGGRAIMVQQYQRECPEGDSRPLGAMALIRRFARWAQTRDSHFWDLKLSVRVVYAEKFLNTRAHLRKGFGTKKPLPN